MLIEVSILNSVKVSIISGLCYVSRKFVSATYKKIPRILQVYNNAEVSSDLPHCIETLVV